MSRIEDYYNVQYDEWGRLERHRLEFEVPAVYRKEGELI